MRLSPNSITSERLVKFRQQIPKISC